VSFGKFMNCLLILFFSRCIGRVSAHIQYHPWRCPWSLPLFPSASFAKENIALAPNNASAWNYLRGVLNHARLSYSTQATFATQYIVHEAEAGTDDAFDLENPPPSKGADLPCAAAIEFMADVHEASGKEGISKAVEVRNPYGN
jgi:hypothetical protein